MPTKQKDHGEPPPFVKWLIWLFRKDTWKEQPIIATIATIIVISVVFCAVYEVYLRFCSSGKNGSSQNSGKVVLLMDSIHPDFVYLEESKKNRKTNAHDIREILDYLLPRENMPMELVTLDWQEEEAIIRRNPQPTSIVIHASAFNKKPKTPLSSENHQDSEASNKRFISFLEYMANSTEMKFIIYSRGFCGKNEAREKLEYELLINNLRGRVDILAVCYPDYWKDDSVIKNLQLKVKSALNW